MSINWSIAIRSGSKRIDRSLLRRKSSPRSMGLWFRHDRRHDAQWPRASRYPERTGRHLWPFECLRLTGSGRGRDGLLLCRVRKELDRRYPGWGVGGFLHQRRCDGLWDWFAAERTFPQHAADRSEERVVGKEWVRTWRT